MMPVSHKKIPHSVVLHNRQIQTGSLAHKQLQIVVLHSGYVHFRANYPQLKNHCGCNRLAVLTFWCEYVFEKYTTIKIVTVAFIISIKSLPLLMLHNHQLKLT